MNELCKTSLEDIEYECFNDDNGFFNEWLLKEKEKKENKSNEAIIRTCRLLKL
jgi:dTDP-4-dehydrorhamnose 3,5-epimerase-like enzyme